ncbi:MAG: aminopeptidase P family protein [Desulfobacteraceae bacterium]|nr:MAG: aminopeptidase P family protein [Desulfobacteraceae bacterium]
MEVSIQFMEDPKERISPSVSTAELERRWKASREVMREDKIDYLVMRNDEEFLGGYVRWFSDFPARHSYPITVIFPVDDEMTTIVCGNLPPSDYYPPKWAARGIKRRLGAPYFASMHYTDTLDAELAVEVLKEKKGATIGLLRRSSIPITFYEYLCKHLPGHKFVDATDRFDYIKAVKSPEEIEFIKKTALLQDEAIEHLRTFIRPGRKDFEIYTEAQYATSMRGSTRQLILVGSNARGVVVRWQVRHLQNRVIREGDQVNVLIETNGPGGFYTEIGRVFSLGKPAQALVDAMGTAIEAQNLSLSLLKPGADPREIWDANNEFLQKRGYLPERRLYAHGQGYDLVERPAIRYDETMKIQAGMNLTVHPWAINDSAWSVVTDNYLVTKTGMSECLHKTQKEVIVIE